MSPLRRDDPERLGRYELTGRLGAGGMGVVYLAEDPDGTYVAVKLVHAALAGDPEFRARFRGEVERARQVPPFCTAEVLDADLGHEPPYLVVEYVDGPSLVEVVEGRGPLRAAALHSLAAGVATALSGIHGAGVVHRDLKPENVLLAPGSPKVIDFGLARARESSSRYTRTGQMVGTVAYMAPERFSSEPGEPAAPAADVFAWGCVIAYAGTGRTPFEGDSPGATAARILTQPPRLDGLPEPLRAVVGRALAKDPADRPTARELLDLLLDQRTPAAAPAPAPPAPPGRARPRVLAALAVLLVVAGMTATGLIVRAQRNAPERARPFTDASATVATVPRPAPSATSRRTTLPPTAPVRATTSTAERSPAAPRAAANPSGRNLALHRTATASSREGPPWGPSQAVDGDPDSRWSSGFSDPQWIAVDLGKRWRISSITVRWEHAYAVGYRIEISTDGTTWKRVYGTTAGEGGTVTVRPGGTPARYVRMYGTRRVSTYGYSLYELEVR
ncbi:discoidin domain-containing protein [Couchioplanes caeruleus]|uniref:protein kinase domain-containing protein n=1 Tax=Couchioplanes caeruleus TaxID=56438 RepID=UPI0020BFD5F4|nr:protein kinase [Couchioplanes caeruleus]UQU61891.1 discoidin domain-containing protein [Couchioplanes caeruleus]